MNYLRSKFILIRMQVFFFFKYQAAVHPFHPGKISVIDRFYLCVLLQQSYNKCYSKMSEILGLILTN